MPSWTSGAGRERRRGSLHSILHGAPSLPGAKGPVRITAGLRGADLVEFRRRFCAESQIGGTEITLEVIHGSRANDRGDNAGAVRDPA